MRSPEWCFFPAPSQNLGHLIALGLSTRWALSIIVRQHVTLLGIATVLGLLIGLPAALLAAWLIPGFELRIPWGQLATLVASVYAAVLLATLLSCRRLTARERVTG